MNRRRFVKRLCSAALLSAGWKQFANSEQRKSRDGDAKLAAYNRQLSKRVYPKIKNLAVPIETVVLTFNTKFGFWEPRVKDHGFLKPALGRDGILRWRDPRGKKR